MKKSLYKAPIIEVENQDQRMDLLRFDFKNNLLSLQEKLNDYYCQFIENSEFFAVIPALPKGDDKAYAYYSCPQKSMDNPTQDLDDTLSPRLSPVFLVDNTSHLLSVGKSIFEIENNVPKFADYKQEGFYQNRIFMFDTEYSHMYVYNDKKIEKSLCFDDMCNHILKNPVVLFFKGCDDGHCGLRFPDREKALEYIKSIDVFDNIFASADPDFFKSILKIKKETGQDISELFKGNLEYHN